jgi:hypothetical protein
MLVAGVINRRDLALGLATVLICTVTVVRLRRQAPSGKPLEISEDRVQLREQATVLLINGACMSQKQLETRVTELVQYDPQRDSTDPNRGAGKVILLAANVARALEAVGGQQELQQRAERFECLTGRKSQLEKSRVHALKKVRSALRNAEEEIAQRPVRFLLDDSGNVCGASRAGVIPSWRMEGFLTDLDYTVLNFPDALRNIDEILDTLSLSKPAKATVKQFRDELRQLGREVDWEYLFGCFLISLCRDAHADGSHPKLHQSLVSRLARHFPQVVQQIQAAARELVVVVSERLPPSQGTVAENNNRSCYRRETEPLPIGFHPEPLNGCALDLAEAISGKRDPRPFKTRARNGAIWVVAHSRNKLSVYLLNVTEYTSAKARLVELQKAKEPRRNRRKST